MSGGFIPVSYVYSPKAFMDAIAKWIIADNQVSIYYSI
jgi:hypothetical protein